MIKINKSIGFAVLSTAVLVFLFFGSASVKAEETNKTSQENGFKDLGGDWYEVTGSAGWQNLSFDEAKLKAEKNACLRAIDYHCGIALDSNLEIISINSSADGVQQNDFFHISKQASSGLIIGKQLLKEWVNNKSREIFVKLKVKVGRQAGKKDISFYLTAKLASKNLKNKEPLEIQISSSKACYITVLNISNGSVYALFPNRFIKNNYLGAEGEIIIPGAKGREIGLTFPAILPEGKDKETGIIKILATKQVFPLTEFNEISEYGSYKTAYAKLMRQFIAIPRDQIEEAELAYTITR